MDRAQLAVGQPVMLYDGGGSARPSRITWIGRDWLKVDGYREKLRIDTQKLPGAVGHGVHWRTLEQYAEETARSDALAFLQSQGISVDWRSPWRDRIVELADLIRGTPNKS